MNCGKRWSDAEAQPLLRSVATAKIAAVIYCLYICSDIENIIHHPDLLSQNQSNCVVVHLAIHPWDEYNNIHFHNSSFLCDLLDC